jgi:hypothetical protein
MRDILILAQKEASIRKDSHFSWNEKNEKGRYSGGAVYTSIKPTHGGSLLE